MTKLQEQISAQIEQSLTVATPEQKQISGVGFEPQNLQEAHHLCKMLLASGFLPTSIRTPEAALAILLAGKDFGLPPMMALRSINIIQGKPTMGADLMVGIVQKSGICEYFVCVSEDEKQATYKAKRFGQDEVVRSFTMEDAKRAGLLGKENWVKYPRAMLRARCKADLARDVFPDVLNGCYTPDELGRDSVQNNTNNVVHAEVLEDLGK